MVVSGVSALSSFDAVDNWFKTDVGYYHHNPSFGNKLIKLQFKAFDDAVFILDEIMDEIIDDLGYEVASSISKMELVRLKETDKYMVIVTKRDGQQVISQIGE